MSSLVFSRILSALARIALVIALGLAPVCVPSPSALDGTGPQVSISLSQGGDDGGQEESEHQTLPEDQGHSHDLAQAPAAPILQPAGHDVPSLRRALSGEMPDAPIRPPRPRPA